MQILTRLLLLSIVGLSCASLPLEVPTFELDLALPPKLRYTKFIPLYKDKVQKVLDYVKSYVPAIVFDLFVDVLADIDNYIGQPYADEMRGLAEASQFPLGDVLLLNLFYEITAGCTSIIAHNPKNNSATHARNLDFPIPHLGPITVNVRVVRNGTFLYHFTTFAGYIGTLSAMKPATSRKQGWSFSLDERDSGAQIVAGWINMLEALLRGGRVATLMARGLLDQTGTPNEYDFFSASAALRAVHMTAPSYLIVGNTTGGMVITRDRDAPRDVWELTSDMRPMALVETNYDHWLPPPSDDNRRDPALRRLNATDPSNYGPGSLYTILSTSPNLNSQTVYTTVMEIATNYYKTVVWQAN